MAKEVEMADAPEVSKPGGDKKEAALPQPPSVHEQLAANVKLIEKAVKQKETRALFTKLLRQTQMLRKRLTSHDVQTFVRSVMPESLASFAVISEHLKQVRTIIE